MVMYQVQNSDVVTDQSATTNGDNNTVSQSSTNDTTQSQTATGNASQSQNSDVHYNTIFCISW